MLVFNREVIGMTAKWQGNRLKVRRKQLGLTTAALAQQIGCTRPALSIWESGKASPGGNFVILLGIILRIEPRELYIIEEQISEIHETEIKASEGVQ